MTDIALQSTARTEVRPIHLSTTDLGLMFLRLALGVIFTAHGWLKVTAIHQTVAGMSGMGIPVPLVYVDIFTEFFGGLAILFGLLSRLAALGITVVMLVAIFKVHLENGFFMNWYGNQKGEGIEYHLLVIGMCLLIALVGPGRLALADIERRWLSKSTN